MQFKGVPFIEWDSETYDVIPKWLTSVKYAPNFTSMGEGDGRNQELFNYILNNTYELRVGVAKGLGAAKCDNYSRNSRL